MDDRQDLAVVAVAVGNELAAIIGMQVLEAKSERHDEVLHEFDQSRQCLVFRRDEVNRLKHGVLVVALDHEAVVSARRERHETQEVGFNEPKPFRDLGLARIFAYWLLDAIVDLADVARGHFDVCLLSSRLSWTSDYTFQRASQIDSRLGDVPRGLHGVHV